MSPQHDSGASQSQRTVTLVMAVSLLLFSLSTPLRVCAYAPSVIVSAATTTTRLQQSFQGFEESEWYCPPPVTKKATVATTTTTTDLLKTRISPGQKALQTDVTTVQEFKDILHDGDERLTIVKFYASWCKSCAKFSRKLDLFATQHADIVDKNYKDLVRNRGTVRIVNVEYGAAMELCRSLHVKQLPTVHIYQSGQKVQDFICPPSQFHRVTELTEYYVKRNTNTGATPKQQQQQEQLFESTLDKGRNMIQRKLREEKLAQGQQPASQVAFAPSVAKPSPEAPNAPNDGGNTAVMKKAGFWNRFRRVEE